MARSNAGVITIMASLGMGTRIIGGTTPMKWAPTYHPSSSCALRCVTHVRYKIFALPVITPPMRIMEFALNGQIATLVTIYFHRMVHTIEPAKHAGLHFLPTEKTSIRVPHGETVRQACTFPTKEVVLRIASVLCVNLVRLQT